jgi:hypothetical protein
LPLGRWAQVLVAAVEQETARWNPARVLAGFLAIAVQAIVLVGLTSATRFRFFENVARKPANSPMYLTIWPTSPSQIRGNRYQPLPPTITPSEIPAVLGDLPEPNFVIPDADIPQLSWGEAAHRATEAEAKRELSSARPFTFPPRSENTTGTDESMPGGNSQWDAAKPKGLELDDYETRLWVNEHCYLYAGQPAPLQYLGAKCRLGSTAPQSDLFDDFRAKAPGK